jgi:hypothetical protein
VKRKHPTLEVHQAGPALTRIALMALIPRRKFVMRKLSRKGLVVVTALVLVAAAGVAYAFWSTTGSGTGSASTGNVTAITVNQTSTVSGLAPGLPAQALSGNFDNPNSGPVYVTSVTATVTGTDKAGCTASDYTISGSPATVGAQVASGSGVGSWSGITIAFNNKPSTNQDACKGATVSISYTSN